MKKETKELLTNYAVKPSPKTKRFITPNFEKTIISQCRKCGRKVKTISKPIEKIFLCKSCFTDYFNEQLRLIELKKKQAKLKMIQKIGVGA